jgi:hypothetical protein
VRGVSPLVRISGVRHAAWGKKCFQGRGVLPTVLRREAGDAGASREAVDGAGRTRPAEQARGDGRQGAPLRAAASHGGHGDRRVEGAGGNRVADEDAGGSVGGWPNDGEPVSGWFADAIRAEFE